MIQTEIRDGILVATFAPWTRPFVRRAEMRVPLTAIREVRVEANPQAVATGTHAGLLVSGFIKVGTWTGLNGVRRLVCARRDLSGVRIVLTGRTENVDELVLSVPDAPGLQAEIMGANA
ncbi:hypothetical protein [Microtetraspora sp. NBRC 16547]|uniref:hypothetical protein n=1 Tax=Microtetraspora sp. NBRC 16547 TaxID=3030993 RepID=UPI0024A4B3BC|nr:hypothetical protein [Microtetraspora sp. NBRC 16547]GLW96640.1 hypothetical protein Misp02_07270 [Microtetraspora sp. NBRC 16547]